VPSSYQYPIEKQRDLQRRWSRLLQAATNEIGNTYRRAEKDHDLLGNALDHQRATVKQGGLKRAVVDQR
jgi:hypothetical protein